MLKHIPLVCLLAGVCLLSAATITSAAPDAAPLVIDASVRLIDAAPAPTVVAPAIPTIVLDAPDAPSWWVSSFATVKSGTWTIRLGFLLTVLVWVLRKKVGILPAFFRTDKGGPVLVFSVSALGGLAHSLTAGVTPDLTLLFTTLKIGAVAIAAYVTGKKITDPGPMPWPLPPPPAA